MTNEQLLRTRQLGTQLLAALESPLQSSQSESQALRNALVQLYTGTKTYLRILEVEIRTNRPTIQQPIKKGRR